MLHNSVAAADRRRSWFLVVSGVVAVVMMVLIASPTFAGAGSRDRDHGVNLGGRGCHGIANAYSHVLANAADEPDAARSLDELRAVAEKKSCDLSEVQAAEHRPGSGADDNGKPPADVVADHCQRIADKLAVAQSRPHGNSAAAFARQADKWSCPAL